MNYTRTITRFESGPTSSGILTWYRAALNCGHNWYAADSWTPITGKVIGDTVECSGCLQDARDYEWLSALDTRLVIRSRYRQWCGIGQYHFYRRDPESPSGVMLIGSVTATPAIDALLREKRLSPLSPTEGLRGEL